MFQTEVTWWCGLTKEGLSYYYYNNNNNIVSGYDQEDRTWPVSPSKG